MSRMTDEGIFQSFYVNWVLEIKTLIMNKKEEFDLLVPEPSFFQRLFRIQPQVDHVNAYQFTQRLIQGLNSITWQVFRDRCNSWDTGRKSIWDAHNLLWNRYHEIRGRLEIDLALEAKLLVKLKGFKLIPRLLDSFEFLEHEIENYTSKSKV